MQNDQTISPQEAHVMLKRVQIVAELLLKGRSKKRRQKPVTKIPTKTQS